METDQDSSDLEDASSDTTSVVSESLSHQLTEVNDSDTDEENIDPQDSMPRNSQRQSTQALPSQQLLTQLASHGVQEFGAQSTSKQYQRIFDEYKDFADAIHNTDKMMVQHVFEFLTYHAHRSLRSQKDLRPTDDIPTEPLAKRPRLRHKFSPADFHAVMQELKDRDMSNAEQTTANRLDTLDKHYAALLRHAPDSLKARIRDHQGIKDLKKYVTARQKAAATNSYQEKVNPQIEKFGYARITTKLEIYFWEKHKNHQSLGNMCASLRNRYHLLSTVQTLARHESCLSCRLSNFQLLRYRSAHEPEEYTVLFRNIQIGKSNNADTGKRDVVQAKSIRHKDPERCEQGALALYLFCRMHYLNEDLDLTSNEAWFNIRTSISFHGWANSDLSPREKSQGASTFYQEMRTAFFAIMENPSHVRHFGRCAGPAFLELEEVNPEYIKELGNWLNGVFELHYSSKIGWEALRVAAGFPKEKGQYYVPRSHIKPPDTLKRMVFPNVERAKDAFTALPPEQQVQRKTASNFLFVMDYLAEVFIQDMCCLMMQRCDHNIFLHDFFVEDEFLQYRQRFNEEYERLTHPSQDPTVDKLKKAAPAIGHHIGSLHVQQMYHNHVLHGMRNELLGMLSDHNQLVLQRFDYIAHQLNHVNYVGDAMVHAHQTSPFRQHALPISPENNSPSPNQLRQATEDATTTTTPALPTITSPPRVPNSHATDSTPPQTFPPFPQRFSSLEEMYNDWHGDDSSVFADVGGLKSLSAMKEYRKQQSEATKKALRRLAFFIRFVEHEMEHDKEKTLTSVLDDIKNKFKETSKTEITLSGTETVLRKLFLWNGRTRGSVNS